jgi:hypothetical protein
MAFGWLITVFIAPPNRVVRSDGSAVQRQVKSGLQLGFGHQLNAAVKAYGDWRIIALIPMLYVQLTHHRPSETTHTRPWQLLCQYPVFIPTKCGERCNVHHSLKIFERRSVLGTLLSMFCLFYLYPLNLCCMCG